MIALFLKEETAYGLMLTAIIIYLAFRNVGAVILVTILIIAIIAIGGSGGAGRVWAWANRLRLRLFADKGDAPGVHDVYFGTNEATDQSVYQNLVHTGNIFVSGQTRFGKTRMLYVLIDDLISRHSPDELLIGFSDAKEVTFSIYSRLPHLFAPIATTVKETEMLLDLAIAEMDRRKLLFSEYADDHICTNLSEYADLSGQHLPYIMLIFDELADSVELKSDAEDKLTSLAKMGLAFGITLVLATQRSTAKAISHEAQSQCATAIVTYMKGNTEYGSISGVPKTIYKHMTPKKGRFMMYSPELAETFTNSYPEYGGWGFVQAGWIENADLARKARALSKGQAGMNWDGYARPSEVPSLPKLTGSMDAKMAALAEIYYEVRRPLVPADLRNRFAMGKNTITNLLKNWESQA